MSIKYEFRRESNKYSGVILLCLVLKILNKKVEVLFWFYHLNNSRRDTIYKNIEKDLFRENPKGNAYQRTNLQ